MSNEAETTSYLGKNWAMFLMLVSGIALVGVAAYENPLIDVHSAARTRIG